MVRPGKAATAFVGLGSNIDDPVAQVRQALTELGAIARTRLVAHSSLYRTAPVGYLDQPDFINAVARLQTSLTSRALLHALQSIEERHGRKRSTPNGPRSLDLDLLLFDEQKLDGAELTLPHPRLHERAFVLVPLAEIAPDALVPGRGTVRSLLAQLDRGGVAQLENA